MKWLVLIALALPVMLSALLVFSGGVRELEDELGDRFERNREWQTISSGDIPRSAKKMRWKGKDKEFLDGAILLTEEGPVICRRVYEGEEGWQWMPFDRDPDSIWIFNRGRYIIRGDELWFNSKRKSRGGYHYQQVDPDREYNRIDLSEVITIDALGLVYLFLLYPQAICLLLALFYGTSVLGHELDGKTLTYLFTRPIPRWKIVVGKFLGIVAALIPAVTVSLVVSGLLLGTGMVHLLTLLAGSAGAVTAYAAVFTLIGFMIPRRAMIVGLLYGIIFEFVLSFAPALVNEITVTYYLRSMVAGLLDIPVPIEIARIVGGASVPGAIFGLVTITLVCLGLASSLAARQEYVIKDEA